MIALFAVSENGTGPCLHISPNMGSTFDANGEAGHIWLLSIFSIAKKKS